MTTVNRFDLLGESDNEDPSLVIETLCDQLLESAVVSHVETAESRPLQPPPHPIGPPPLQPVRELRNENRRGRGRANARRKRGIPFEPSTTIMRPPSNERGRIKGMESTTVIRPRSDQILKDETKKNADNLTVKDNSRFRVIDNRKDFQDIVKAMVAETENKKPEENKMGVRRRMRKSPSPSGLLKFPLEIKKPKMTYEEAYDIMIHGRTHLFNCAIGPSYPQGPDLYKMDSSSFDPIFNKIVERPYPASVPGPSTDGENSEFFCSCTEQFSPSEELNPILWKELALKALEHKQLHNMTQSDTLELFGEVNAVVAFAPKFVGFHLDFKAKYRNNGLSKIMFAEALREKTGNVTINFCDIIDPQDPGLVKGCRHCPRGILHPQGFRFINTTGEANPVGWWMGRRNPRRRW